MLYILLHKLKLNKNKTKNAFREVYTYINNDLSLIQDDIYRNTLLKGK